MTEQQAFIRQICEQPADDTVRLVYADWLEEHGEAERAEFIRIQVELAQPEPSLQYLATQVDNELLAKMTRLERGRFNFHELRARSYPIASKRLDAHRKNVGELRRRERRWIGDNRDAMRSELAGMEIGRARQGWPDANEPNAIFARGFVSRIKLPCADFLKHAKAIFAAHPVTEVRLTNREPRLDWGEWLWAAYRDSEDVTEHSLSRSVLPWSIACSQKESGDGSGDEWEWYYDTAELALAAVSDACVAHGRSLAELPPPA